MTHKRFKTSTILAAGLVIAAALSAGFTWVKNKRFPGNVYIADAIYAAAFKEYSTAAGIYIDDVYILDETLGARAGAWTIDPAGYAFNIHGADADFKIESDAADILVVDAGADSIGIGGAPAAASAYAVSLQKDVLIYDAATSAGAVYFTAAAYGIAKTAGHDMRLFTTTGEAILSATGAAGNELVVEPDGDVIIAGGLMVGQDQSPESSSPLHVKNGDSGVSTSANVGLIVENSGSHQAYIHLLTASAAGATLRVTNAKSVIIGNDAIATSATDGFLFLPTMAGPPSGTVYEWDDGAAAVYDTTNDRLWLHNHSDNTWRDSAIGETGTEYTIALGVITVVGDVFFPVDTAADAASDDLDTITMAAAAVGQVITITAANSARTVVAKDSTGNLELAADFSLDHTFDALTLIWTGAAWLQLSTSNNN